MRKRTDRSGDVGAGLRWLVMAIGSGLLLLGAGCASTGNHWSVEEHSYPPLTMSLAAGDELRIKFLGAPQLDSTQLIRQDGKITLDILGEYMAAGKTPEVVRKELTELFGDQLQIKEVSITIVSPAPIFVTGSVIEPGRYSMERPYTALEAIMAAGGFDAVSAEVRSVVVIRHADGKRFGYVLDFKSALAGEEGHPFFLKPFDIVYVPRTRIARLNQAVDQYINRMIPRLGLSYSSEEGGTMYYHF